MKKMKKALRYIAIFCIVFLFLIFVYFHVFKVIWNFNILNVKSYKAMYSFWERGGVFKTFKDCSLLFLMAIFPVLGFYITAKLYKKGFWATLTKPINKLYRKFNAPEPMDDVHIVIKNLGAKTGDIDEIISDKLKEKGDVLANSNTTKSIRQLISVKIEENEKK